MRAMTAGVFFHRSASGASPADTLDSHIAVQEVVPPAGHGPRVQPQQVGDRLVASVAHLERLQAGVQASLLLIEQAEKQHNRCLELIGEDIDVRQPPPEWGRRVTDPARGELSVPRGGIGGTVQIAPGEGRTRQLLLTDQPQQRPLHLHVEDPLELGHEKSGVGLLDQRFRGGQQCPAPRKPHRAIRPQAPRIVLGDIGQRVISPAVGVAGLIGQLRQLPEDRDVRRAPQDVFQLGHRGDLLLPQQRGEVPRAIVFGSHNDRVTPAKEILYYYLATSPRVAIGATGCNFRVERACGLNSVETRQLEFRQQHWSYFCANPKGKSDPDTGVHELLSTSPRL